VAKDVLSLFVGLNEAEPLLVVPSQRDSGLPSSAAAAAAAAAATSRRR
jgi:hypothetical protein